MELYQYERILTQMGSDVEDMQKEINLLKEFIETNLKEIWRENSLANRQG